MDIHPVHVRSLERGEEKRARKSLELTTNRRRRGGRFGIVVFCHGNRQERGERRKPDFWPIVSLSPSPPRHFGKKEGPHQSTAAERWNWALKHGSPLFSFLLSLLISRVFPSKFQRSTFEPTRIRGRPGKQAARWMSQRPHSLVRFPAII